MNKLFFSIMLIFYIVGSAQTKSFNSNNFKVNDTIKCPFIVTSYNGRHLLSEASEDSLRKLAYFLKDNNKLCVIITSHTDSRGSAEFNKKLSSKRAKYLKEFLVTKHQISENRLKYLGLGEDYPIIEEKEINNHHEKFREELHRKNIRFELVVFDILP